MNTLNYHGIAFSNVGWFIPPYVTLGFLTILAKQIHDNGKSFNQDNLESMLSLIYSPEHLAAMVCERYPITKNVQDYKQIISESVAAHFLGLDHVAVTGLMPAIEGSAFKIAQSLSLPTNNISSSNLFKSLATACKDQAIARNIGAVDEIVAMMNSFGEFSEKYLFAHSELYPLEDKTNRHGILHGAYSDEDYGKPINFYKCIASINFLCFVSGFDSGYMPCFAANESSKSQKLAEAYYEGQTIRKRMLP